MTQDAASRAAEKTLRLCEQRWGRAAPDSEPVLREEAAALVRAEYADLLKMAHRAAEALAIARKYAGFDGAHHKDWVIDQMVRALTGDGYKAFVDKATQGKDGPETYEWNEGIPP